MKFYPKEATENPNVLDEIFSEMHEAYKRNKVPMSEEQTKYTLMVMMADDNKIDGIYNDLAKVFPIGGFFKRCTIFPIKYEKKLLLWMGLITMDFGIGGMILIGYYLQWWAFHKNIQQELTFSDVCENVFPFGVVSKETVHEFWDKQKVHASPDNLIDHSGAALSFMPKKETVNSV